MLKRISAVVGLPVLAAGLTFGSVQIATAESPGREEPQKAGRPAAATFHTDADLYGEAQAVHQTAAGAEHIEAEIAALAARLAEEEAARAAARRSGGGGGGGGSRCGGNALECIKQCESHGDYGAVSSNGQYRGAYQFQQSTWESVGGTGDPAAAPPEEQDARAQALYDSAGSAPWGCG